MPFDMTYATTLITKRANELVNRLISCRGHDEPPFLPEEFARFLGIAEVNKAELGDSSAILLRFHDRTVIRVNSNHHPTRQNFSCAHEIGHILFSELKLEKCIKNIEYRTFNPQAILRNRARATERLCDIVATELLMPKQIFGKHLSTFGLSVDSIEPLSHEFRTSIPATAYRIAEVSEEPCLVLIWKPWPPTKPKGLKCAGPRSVSKPYPLNDNVRNPSSLHTAFESSTSVKSSRKFIIGNTKKTLPMESKGFGRGANKYVVSLVFLSR